MGQKQRFSHTGIFTHVAPDPDAFAACWAARRYHPTFKNRTGQVPIWFKSATWNGDTLGPHDVLVDMTVGERGIKGDSADGLCHSAFAKVMQTYAPPEDIEALRPLIEFVDAADSRGTAYKVLLDVSWVEDEATRAKLEEQMKRAETVMRRMDLYAEVGRCMALHPKSWADAIREFFTWMDYQLKYGRRRLKKDREVQEAVKGVDILPGGRVAVRAGKDVSGLATYLYQEAGVKAIVWREGKNIGITVETDQTPVRACNAHTLQVVLDAGESLQSDDGTWFDHVSGFLFSHGTRKAHATTRSKVDLMDLAHAMDRALSEVE